MAVHLRLSRVGKKKVPFYRIVAIDSRKARQAKPLDILGTYDALKSEIVIINLPKIDEWISFGAQPSDSVKKICRLARKNITKASTSNAVQA